MISILIPCYNYNAYDLVSKLEKECLTLKIVFEIICIDDASFSPLNELNQKIIILTNCKFFESMLIFWFNSFNGEKEASSIHIISKTILRVKHSF